MGALRCLPSRTRGETTLGGGRPRSVRAARRPRWRERGAPGDPGSPGGHRRLIAPRPASLSGFRLFPSPFFSLRCCTGPSFPKGYQTRSSLPVQAPGYSQKISNCARDGTEGVMTRRRGGDSDTAAGGIGLRGEPGDCRHLPSLLFAGCLRTRRSFDHPATGVCSETHCR